jgi:signal peptidase I
MLDPVEKQPPLNTDSDSFWHQDMGRLPPGDEGSTVTEVRIGGKSAVREILETIVLTLLIFLAVRALGQNFVVEGESMLPTLNNSQYLIVDKVSYARWDSNFLPRLFGQDVPTDTHYLLGNGPQRGDIIVFHAWHEDKDYIKRVIGLPGDQIEIKFNDHVYVNGVPLTEPYILDPPDYDLAPLTVPANSLFVLGDNRRNSSDSHLKDNGPVSMDQVIGRAWISYWPPPTIGPLPHPTYNLPPSQSP